MKSFVMALLLLTPSISLAQVFEASLGALKDKPSYSAIEFLSAAESSELPLVSDSESLPPDTPRTETLRVVVYRSEIYQALAIETLTTGLEGCCGKVARRQSVDLEAFASRFGFKGEVSGFVFSTWSSPRSFRFTYQGMPFHAAVLKSGRIRIERGLGANNSFKPSPLRSFRTPPGSSGGSA